MTDTEVPLGTGGRIRRIVVAYDGSEPSARAVRFVLGAWSREDAEIWIVHATDPPRSVAEPRTEEEQGSETGAIEQNMRSIQRSADPTGHRVHISTREGAAPAVIISMAAEVKADLIVVGTRGLRSASRLLLGSVSAEVLRRSSGPVTVIP